MKIFYDGDCIFCSNYVTFAKLRSTVDDIELISLRSDHPAIEEVKRQKFRINRGFVVEHNGKYFEGAAAFSYLNFLMTGGNYASKIIKFFTSHPLLSTILYQFLVFGRYTTLGLQGLSLIDLNSGTIKTTRFHTIARFSRIALLCTWVLILFSTYNRLTDGDPIAAAYSGLCLVITSVLYWYAVRDNVGIENFINRISSANWRVLGGCLIVFILLVNAGYPLAIRRFIGFFLATPVVGLLIHYALRYIILSSKFQPISMLPVFALLFAIIPGFVLGPFYGGIAGWVIRVSKSDPVTISGYQLVNDAGQVHWISHAFFQPHGHIGRFERAYLATPGQTEDSYVHFIFETYKRNFSLIEKGRFPHQWALGSFAYPTHSLGKYETKRLSKDFHPSRITQIIRKIDRYTIEGELIESIIVKKFDVSNY